MKSQACISRRSAFLAFAVALFAPASVSWTAERAALVIGNNSYQHVSPLHTAANDAKAVWEKLQSLGFAAGEKPMINSSLEDMVEAVDAFKTRALGSSAAVVYFAGHGIEHEGINYLVPVDARLERALQLKTQAYSLNTLLAEVKSLQVPTRLVILDCCRNNPLPGRSWTRGVTAMADVTDESLGGATMVVFSTAPGTEAKDSLTTDDVHSPFAAALIAQLSVPGLGLFNLFGEVEKNVFDATRESQKPKVRFNGDVSPFAAFIMNNSQTMAVNSTPQPVATAAAMQSPKVAENMPAETVPQLLGTTSLPSDLPSSGYFTRSGLFTSGPYAAYNATSQESILRKAQGKLKQAGLYQGSLDGTAGPGTGNAIIEWQRQQLLPVTGRLDMGTLASMSLTGQQEEVYQPTTSSRKSQNRSPAKTGETAPLKRPVRDQSMDAQRALIESFLQP